MRQKHTVVREWAIRQCVHEQAGMHAWECRWCRGKGVLMVRLDHDGSSRTRRHMPVPDVWA